MAESLTAPQPPISVAKAVAVFGQWCQRQPLSAVLLFGVLATVIYFFGLYGYAMGGDMPTAVWAAQAWDTDNDLEHGWLILPAAIVVAWMHRGEIARLPKRGSSLGLLALIPGVLAFLAAVWTVQPRIAIVSFPMIIFGGVWFLFGWATARKIAFACALLLFMVPLGFILGHTEPLQRLVASVVVAMCNLVGLGIERDGVTLLASDGSFHCEVAGGCSGIRSLMAMTLLSAVYVHFTQKEVWKKVLIFSFTLPFAVIGNIARVFTIVLFAKFISVEIGTGPYHDISGFLVTIPIALWAMIQFGNLLNRDWRKVALATLKPDDHTSVSSSAAGPTPTKASSNSPISYDY